MSAPVADTASQQPRVCDYEGSAYRTDFWGCGDRDYEDLAERHAIHRLLPARGERLVEIGAGFGRLADLYRGYDQIILLDYARSMLDDARARYGNRCTYVCADLYRLPLASSAIDTAVMVRVLHHVEDPRAALSGVARILRPGGSLLLEFANKRHAKAILRFISRRTRANPFDDAPMEFAPLHWDFHPDYIERVLDDCGLAVRERRAVSHFRAAGLKHAIPAGALARADNVIGGPLAGAALAPSQFLRAARLIGGAPSCDLWRCPACGTEPLPLAGEGIRCTNCRRYWRLEDGVLMMRDDSVPIPGGAV